MLKDFSAMSDIVIQDERPEDAAAIGRITAAAFAGTAYGHNGEAGIVEALRADGALTVSPSCTATSETVRAPSARSASTMPASPLWP